MERKFSCAKYWKWISPIFAFKIPARRHFEFLWGQMVPQLFQTKGSCFLTIAATIWRQINSKWRRTGNLKKNRWYSFPIFCTRKLSFHLLKKELEFRLYFQQFNANLLWQWRFPSTCCYYCDFRTNTCTFNLFPWYCPISHVITIIIVILFADFLKVCFGQVYSVRNPSC